MNKIERVRTADKALLTYSRQRLYLDDIGRLRMYEDWGDGAGPRADLPASLCPNGMWPVSHRRYSGGGTQMNSVAQLIRWVRDLPRLPLDSWEYWASETVRLCNPETLAILKGSDYGDKTSCVLCGSPKFQGGLDWWSLNGVTGPSCKSGHCQQENL